MNFWCWHRPGIEKKFARSTFRLCRHCGVPVEECPCVSWRLPDGKCPICEGSGWIALIRSRLQTLRDSVCLSHGGVE